MSNISFALFSCTFMFCILLESLCLVHTIEVLSTRDIDWSVTQNHLCRSLQSKIKSHPSSSWHIRHSCFDNLALHNFVSTTCSRFTFFSPSIYRKRQNLTNNTEKWNYVHLWSEKTTSYMVVSRLVSHRGLHS